MGTAAERVKQRIAGSEGATGAKDEGKGEDEELERALKLVDSIEAKDLIRATVREKIAQANLRAQQAEQALASLAGGGKNVETKSGNEEEKKKIIDDIGTNAKFLLDKGVDPKTVGQYLIGAMGQSVGGSITIGPLGQPPGQQGITFNDVKALVQMLNENRPSSELKEVLEGLKSSVTALAANKPQPLDPIQMGRQYAQFWKALRDEGTQMGFFKEPPAGGGGDTGESTETLREKYRHEEKMEELKADREHKERLADIASEIPERIGKGIADQALEGGNGQGESAGLEEFECEDCKTKIPIPHEATQVTCPKCKSIFKRSPK